MEQVVTVRELALEGARVPVINTLPRSNPATECFIIHHPTEAIGETQALRDQSILAAWTISTEDAGRQTTIGPTLGIYPSPWNFMGSGRISVRFRPYPSFVSKILCSLSANLSNVGHERNCCFWLRLLVENSIERNMTGNSRLRPLHARVCFPKPNWVFNEKSHNYSIRLGHVFVGVESSKRCA
jgi:hypothetical protein